MAIAYKWQDLSPIIDSKPIFGRYSFGFPSPVQRHKMSTGKGNNLLTPTDVYMIIDPPKVVFSHPCEVLDRVP